MFGLKSPITEPLPLTEESCVSFLSFSVFLLQVGEDVWSGWCHIDVGTDDTVEN